MRYQITFTLPADLGPEGDSPLGFVVCGVTVIWAYSLNEATRRARRCLTGAASITVERAPQ